MLCLIINAFNQRIVVADTFLENEKISSTIEELISGLDLDEIKNQAQKLELFSVENVESYILSLVNNEGGFNINAIFEGVKNDFISTIIRVLPIIVSIGVVCVLLSLLTSFFHDKKNDNLIVICSFFSSACVIGFLAILFKSVLDTCVECLNSMSSQMQAVFPVMLTILQGAGAVSSVSIFKPLVSVLCAIISSVCLLVLIPISSLYFLFSAISSLTERVRLNKTCEFLKSAFKWIVGVVSLVFCFFVTAQGITASTYDGLSFKAIKYAFGSGLPLVNSLINGGFDVVFACCVLIKNAVGSFSLILLVLSIVKPIINVAVISLLLKLLAALIEPATNSPCIKIISGTADALNLVLSTVIMVAVCYFVMLILVICSLGGAV